MRLNKLCVFLLYCFCCLVHNKSPFRFPSYSATSFKNPFDSLIITVDNDDDEILACIKCMSWETKLKFERIYRSMGQLWPIYDVIYMAEWPQAEISLYYVYVLYRLFLLVTFELLRTQFLAKHLRRRVFYIRIIPYCCCYNSPHESWISFKKWMQNIIK